MHGGADRGWGVRFTLVDFVRESNRIEGIHRRPDPHEVRAHERFLSQRLETMDRAVAELERFVKDVSGAEMRRVPGMNVRVGNHTPPVGGAHVEKALRELLTDPHVTPWARHVAYETLHPFMDGNGRSGRVLWLWNMGGIKKVPLGFLHSFYYQTLEGSRVKKKGLPRSAWT